MGFSFCEEVLMSPFKSTDSISMSMSVIKRRADRVKTNTPACTATNQHGSFSNSWIGGKRQMAGQLWSLTHIFINLNHISFTASHKRDCPRIFPPLNLVVVYYFKNHCHLDPGTLLLCSWANLWPSSSTLPSPFSSSATSPRSSATSSFSTGPCSSSSLQTSTGKHTPRSQRREVPRRLTLMETGW